MFNEENMFEELINDCDSGSLWDKKKVRRVYKTGARMTHFAKVTHVIYDTGGIDYDIICGLDKRGKRLYAYVKDNRTVYLECFSGFFITYEKSSMITDVREIDFNTLSYFYTEKVFIATIINTFEGWLIDTITYKEEPTHSDIMNNYKYDEM